MISALIVAKNEELFIQGCLERILPYVSEVIFVDNGSIDKTKEIVWNLKNPKIKIFNYPETDNMGELRQFSLDQATQDWIWQIDADEWYENDACEAIRMAVETPGEAISFRVGYHQLSWRKGYKQANFKHYPDRLYRRDAVDRYDGMLPNDMTKVKKEFYKFRPFLEYDNEKDQSFENPVQPILPVRYYHLARTRGYNYEYLKWFRYNAINHKDWTLEYIDQMTRVNQWVGGLYDLEPVAIPFELPQTSQKVSIVIPNYQYADFVGKAIESCQNQTVKPHEIIVVDDFSQDNSVEVIQRYDVKLVRQNHNSQVAACRNTGAMKATGDYLIFLDADDELAPTFIEETLKEMKGDIQVVYTDLEFIGDQQGMVGYPDFNIELLKQSQIIPSACALIDRRIFEQVGGFNQDWYEDFSFWLRVANAGFNFKHIGKPLFRYRKHGSSRINMLDEKQQFGFEQLKQYGKY